MGHLSSSRLCLTSVFRREGFDFLVVDEVSSFHLYRVEAPASDEIVNRLPRHAAQFRCFGLANQRFIGDIRLHLCFCFHTATLHPIERLAKT
jgi:hypothetical protein